MRARVSSSQERLMGVGSGDIVIERPSHGAGTRTREALVESVDVAVSVVTALNAPDYVDDPVI